MHIVIVSRIFAPEASAATPILTSIALSFQRAGHRVTVLTARLPAGTADIDLPGVTIKRARVLRDRQGYVRGYLQYLSFDLPLALRMLARRRADVYFVEPPPTTGAVVRVITWFLRRPYFYRAADIWSDAAQMATGSRIVIGLLRSVERFALRGSRIAFATSDGVADRMRELGVQSPTIVTGWGVDTTTFHFTPRRVQKDRPYLIYAGTHSEWHGAGIFIDAFASISKDHPDARLIFVGNGSERGALMARVESFGLTTVEFKDAVVGSELAPLLAGATASLASLKPGQGYDYAFTTKAFPSLAVGCPVVFSGVGPTRGFIDAARNDHAIGEAVPYDVDAVAKALDRALRYPVDDKDRRVTSDWTAQHYSVESIAQTILHMVTSTATTPDDSDT
ncbi:MAG: glycosyltransferase family 4 protein [Demequinaceae bacterium]|nr:glycosyltransferase family 4 protein [Demequinaceae bacterium]